MPSQWTAADPQEDGRRYVTEAVQINGGYVVSCYLAEIGTDLDVHLAATEAMMRAQVAAQVAEGADPAAILFPELPVLDDPPFTLSEPAGEGRSDR